MRNRFMRREFSFLGDIVAEADVVLRHIDGCSLDRFVADPILSRAVLHSLMIIGEAANRIPVEVQSRHPQVPWRDLAALRNRIVHDYPGVDLKLVWGLISQRLSKLREQIVGILEREDDDDAPRRP
ncbi:MAG: DUF86 domain-containing protein [Bryobacteraceae bacterium]